jgi:hypothetical protein
MKENWMALAVAIMKEDCSVNEALNEMGIHFKYKKEKKNPLQRVQSSK